MSHFPNKNYFTMPNEIFSLGLDASEIAVYAYLRCLESRSTYQCWPSYTTIGNSVGRASDFALSGSEAGSAASSPSRSAGFNSLFDENTSTQAAATQSASTADAGVQAASSGYDPYRVYEAGGATSHKPTRSISVISPVSYNEVENVARMLRAGDAVVLTLRNTPSQLSKRILDFSFGVASALDATVDCIADKVFAITRVSNLNEDELARLRNQGVI